MRIKDGERRYAYWLCLVPGIGNRTIEKMRAACGSFREIYEEGENFWSRFMTGRQLASILQARGETDPEEAYEELLKSGIRFVLRGDAEYPGRLLEIPDAPFALFGKGRMPEEDILSVAVVGARDCSEYGRFVASEVGKTLGSRGVQVISGMARGIDGISQRAALEAGGRSFGVLGSGADVCYPRENRALYDRLCEQGGILSIYPPGTEARPQNFPPRNRIVSGLADALVVIEARSKSGVLFFGGYFCKTAETPNLRALWRFSQLEFFKKSAKNKLHSTFLLLALPLFGFSFAKRFMGIYTLMAKLYTIWQKEITKWRNYTRMAKGERAYGI